MEGAPANRFAPALRVVNTALCSVQRAPLGRESDHVMFTRILVAADGSENFRRALAEAVKLSHEESSELRIVTVVDEAMQFGSDPVLIDMAKLEGALIAAADKILEEARDSARKAGLNAEIKRLAIVVINQRVGDVEVAEARHWPADLVVMGTHGRLGVSSLVLGSVAEGIAQLSGSRPAGPQRPVS